MTNPTEIHAIFHLQTPDGDDAGTREGTFQSASHAARFGAALDGAAWFETLLPVAEDDGTISLQPQHDKNILAADCILTFAGVLSDVREQESFRRKTPDEQQSLVDTYHEYLPQDKYFAKVRGRYITLDTCDRAYDRDGFLLAPGGWDLPADMFDDKLHVSYLTLQQLVQKDLHAGRRYAARDMQDAIFHGLRHNAACFYITQPQGSIDPDGNLVVQYGAGPRGRHFIGATAVLTGNDLADLLDNSDKKGAMDSFAKAANGGNPLSALLRAAGKRRFAVIGSQPVPVDADDYVYDTRGERIWPAPWPLDPRNAKPFNPK